MFQLALSFGEIRDMTDDVFGIGDMSGMLGRMVQKSIVVFLVRALLGASLLVSTVLVQISMMGLHESDVKTYTADLGRETDRRAAGSRSKKSRDSSTGRSTSASASSRTERRESSGTEIDEVRGEQERT